MTRVLITRAEEDGKAFASLCRAHNLEPVLAPVMQIEYLSSSVALDDVGALAFTSANGVRAFAANSPERARPVFAVGAVTADAARALGFTSVHVAGGDLESLASHIDTEKSVFNGSVLHVAGTARAGDLIGALKQNGLQAKRIVLYEAKAIERFPDHALKALAGDPPIEWVSFFSPRTVDLFLDLVRVAGMEKSLRTMKAACLSQAVADAAHKVSWCSVHVSAERHAASLVEMIHANSTNRA